MTVDDLLVMARTVWAEARGEGEIGMLAVACVIVNRANDPGKDWWGDDIPSVCLKPYQFSCWLESDPNRGKLLMVGPDDKQFLRALRVCAGALLQDGRDPTGKADHYHHRAIAPAWAKGKTPSASIGNHVFYRLGSGN